MADSTDAEYRTRYRGRPSDVQLREDDAEEREDDEDMMSIRLPIASSGEVRNEGDEPLTRAELKGMAQQVNDLSTPAFLDHGQSGIVSGASQYSQSEKLGYWSDAEIEPEAAADGEDLLMATARMPDPESLPAATGDYRKALAIVKEQAKRGVPIDASIGWREDKDSPGGVDLMESSIVGIGADARTNTPAGESALARAADAGTADVAGFVERAREILAEHDTMTDDDTAEDGGTTEQNADVDDESTAGREDDGDDYEDEDEERTCPECDHDVGTDANYCAECGEDLREDDEDGDEEEEETNEDDTDDEDDEEQDVNTSDADTSDGDASEAEADDLRSEIDDLRSDLDDVRSALADGDTDALDVDTDEERSEDDADEQRDTDDTDPDPIDGLGEYA